MNDLVDQCAKLGLPGIAILMFLNTAVGFPPSELICLAFGAAAARDGCSLTDMIVIATIANVMGTSVLFFWARGVGHSRVDATLGRLQEGTLRRIAPFVGLGRAAIRKVNYLFSVYGVGAICVGRNVPLIRSVISIPAGLSQMPRGKFICYTTLGIAPWITSWTLVGYFVGKEPTRLLSYVHGASVLIVLGIAASLGWAFIKHFAKSQSN